MRIVYVYSALATRGGVERILADKMNMLVQLCNDEVFLITYNQGDHPVAFPLDERVHHIDLKVRTHVQYQYGGVRRLWEGFKLNRWLYQRMKRMLAEIQPDIIVTTTAGELSLLMHMKGNIPLVVESHGGYAHLIDYPVMTWFHRRDIRKRYQLLQRAEAIVTLTERDAESWRQDYSQVHVIPNMVHLNPNNRFSTGENHRIIFVGRLAEQKGIPELVAAWRIIYERHPDWRLEVYGDGELSDVFQHVEGLQLHASVDDVFSKYVETSLLMLTSRWEPFGLIIPEAMSCGLPVVAFESDGPCSIITDGIDGFLVRQGNVLAFAERVCQLIEQPDLRARMGLAARETARRYTAATIIPQWKKLFESLTNK